MPEIADNINKKNDFYDTRYYLYNRWQPANIIIVIDYLNYYHRNFGDKKHEGRSIENSIDAKIKEFIENIKDNNKNYINIDIKNIFKYISFVVVIKKQQTVKEYNFLKFKFTNNNYIVVYSLQGGESDDVIFMNIVYKLTTHYNEQNKRQNKVNSYVYYMTDDRSMFSKQELINNTTEYQIIPIKYYISENASNNIKDIKSILFENVKDKLEFEFKSILESSFSNWIEFFRQFHISTDMTYNLSYHFQSLNSNYYGTINKNLYFKNSTKIMELRNASFKRMKNGINLFIKIQNEDITFSPNDSNIYKYYMDFYKKYIKIRIDKMKNKMKNKIIEDQTDIELIEEPKNIELIEDNKETGIEDNEETGIEDQTDIKLIEDQTGIELVKDQTGIEDQTDIKLIEDQTDIKLIEDQTGIELVKDQIGIKEKDNSKYIELVKDQTGIEEKDNSKYIELVEDQKYNEDFDFTKLKNISIKNTTFIKIEDMTNDEIDKYLDEFNEKYKYIDVFAEAFNIDYDHDETSNSIKNLKFKVNNYIRGFYKVSNIKTQNIIVDIFNLKIDNLVNNIINENVKNEDIKNEDIKNEDNINEDFNYNIVNSKLNEIIINKHPKAYIKYFIYSILDENVNKSVNENSNMLFSHLFIIEKFFSTINTENIDNSLILKCQEYLLDTFYIYIYMNILINIMSYELYVSVDKNIKNIKNIKLDNLYIKSRLFPNFDNMINKILQLGAERQNTLVFNFKNEIILFITKFINKIEIMLPKKLKNNKSYKSFIKTISDGLEKLNEIKNKPLTDTTEIKKDYDIYYSCYNNIFDNTQFKKYYDTLLNYNINYEKWCSDINVTRELEIMNDNSISFKFILNLIKKNNSVVLFKNYSKFMIYILSLYKKVEEKALMKINSVSEKQFTQINKLFTLTNNKFLENIEKIFSNFDEIINNYALDLTVIMNKHTDNKIDDFLGSKKYITCNYIFKMIEDENNKIREIEKSYRNNIDIYPEIGKETEKGEIYAIIIDKMQNYKFTNIEDEKNYYTNLLRDVFNISIIMNILKFIISHIIQHVEIIKKIKSNKNGFLSINAADLFLNKKLSFYNENLINFNKNETVNKKSLDYYTIIKKQNVDLCSIINGMYIYLNTLTINNKKDIILNMFKKELNIFNIINNNIMQKNIDSSKLDSNQYIIDTSYISNIILTNKIFFDFLNNNIYLKFYNDLNLYASEPNHNKWYEEKQKLYKDA